MAVGCVVKVAAHDTGGMRVPAYTGTVTAIREDAKGQYVKIAKARSKATGIARPVHITVTKGALEA